MSTANEHQLLTQDAHFDGDWLVYSQLTAQLFLLQQSVNFTLSCREKSPIAYAVHFMIKLIGLTGSNSIEIRIELRWIGLFLNWNFL